MDMNQYIKTFRDFIPKDKDRIKELIPRFHEEMQTIGECLEQKKEQFLI